MTFGYVPSGQVVTHSLLCRKKLRLHELQGIGIPVQDSQLAWHFSQIFEEFSKYPIGHELMHELLDWNRTDADTHYEQFVAVVVHTRQVESQSRQIHPVIGVVKAGHDNVQRLPAA